MKLKYILAASAVAFCAATAAKAADVVVVQDQVIAVPTNVFAPAYSFTGVYIGAQVGGVLGDTGFNIMGQAGGAEYSGVNNDFSPDPSGFIGGLYAGYNFTLNQNVLFGIETDLAWADVSEGTNFNGGSSANEKIYTNIKERWAGATRARIGFASDRWMPFIAAGLAYTKTATNVKFGDTNTPTTMVSGDKTMMGYTVGAGLDYAVTQNLLLRAEYRYNDYGNKTFSNDSFDYRFDYTTNDLRVGLAYKF